MREAKRCGIFALIFTFFVIIAKYCNHNYNFLSGRYIEFNIHSLSYPEFLHFRKLSDSDESILKFIHYGGLPHLSRLSPEQDIQMEYLQNIISTIIYKDVVQRFGIRNTRFLDQLVRFFADNTGSLFSAKRISDFLKSQKIRISHNQVQAYAGYLCNSFLIDRVERYDIVGKRIFESGEKFYFRDTGIRNAIAGYKPEDINKLLENVVYNHLSYCGYSMNTGKSGEMEIDFIAEKKAEKIYIQVCYRLDSPGTIEREFGNLKRIHDNYPKMVVTFDNTIKNTSDGIRQINIREFLLNHNP